MNQRKPGRKPKPKPPAQLVPGSLAAYAEEYFEWMLTRNFSENTVSVRRVHFGYFIQWAAERGIIDPAEVSRAIVERFQKYLYTYRMKNGQPLSFRSQHSRLIPVRAFFKWMARQNYILYNPASEIELPKVDKRLPRNVLTAPEAEQVLNQPNAHDPLGLRDRAILEVFYSTGMRRAELLSLKLYDIDFDRGTVFIRLGKGKKDRMVPIGERALVWVQKYINEVRPKLVGHPDHGTLFLTSQGEPFIKDRMTQMVRDYIDQANIGKRGSCHLFRHTCATLMLEGGADIRFIQQLLGHARLDTTEIYTQVSIRKLKEIHAATHPAKLRKEPGTEEESSSL